MFSFVAMSIGLKVLLYALAALLLAFLTYVILIGFSLFRYATRRTEESAPLNTAGATGDILRRNENAEAKKDHLLTLPHELWEMRQDQVTLYAHYFPAIKKDAVFAGATAVLVHGWRDVHFSRSPAAMVYLDAGFSVLMPILRGHAPSGGKRIDLGCKKRGDILSWMEKLREEQGAPSYFVLDGLSMGAANVLNLSGDPDLPSDVKVILADCGYASLIEQGRWMIRGMKPVIRQMSFAFTLFFFFTFMGYTRSDATPIRQVAKAKVPLMIIHGLEDNFVPTKMGEALYEACTSKQKELLLVEGAKHAMSEFILGEAYWTRKFAFIKKALS